MSGSAVSRPELRCCPLCARDNSGGARIPYAEDPWVLRQCAGCGMVYLENPPAQQALEEDLAWEKTFNEERQRRRQREPAFHRLGAAVNFLRMRVFKRDRLSALARRHFPPGRILDVGCGDGSALARLPVAYVPFGIEVSKELHRLADEKFSSRGGRAVRADALSGMRGLADSSFDGVVMMSYLEHEPKPRQALELAARLLKPGARLIVKVPNHACWNRRVRGARWCGFRSPEHVNYFTPYLLRRLVTECGFRVLPFGFFDHLPTSDNMWLVAEKPG
ncbi:MAG: class I SAM-dependent methyltransferase [Terriglobales bacterium]